MDELPFHLRTLPPEALAVIRFYKLSGMHTALAQAIVEGTGLGDRSFGKAIRRLVTKGYLSMDGNGRYRLTPAGQEAVDEYVDTPDSPLEDADDSARVVERRLYLALPRALVAGQPATALVGIGPDEEGADDSLALLVRLSVLNGEPAQAQEANLLLGGEPERREFAITPGAPGMMRIRVQVFQLDDRDDVERRGGLHVDVPVTAVATPPEPGHATYATTVVLSL